jgi:hypothetical protein
LRSALGIADLMLALVQPGDQAAVRPRQRLRQQAGERRPGQTCHHPSASAITAFGGVGHAFGSFAMFCDVQ